MKTGKIGVIGAMRHEVEILHARMNVACQETIADMTFYEGTVGRMPVVLVMCGIGKVNAGICASLLIDHFHCSAIINTGIAGSLDPELDIEDIVVSDAAIQHDMDVCGLGYEKGQVPGLNVRAFPADAQMRRLVADAVRELAPEVRVFEGTVVSGDTFVHDSEDKHRIHQETGGLCCEMEGAAMAQTAWLFHVPFVIVRAISDKADETSSRSYQEIEEEASLRISAITASVLEHLGERI